MTNFSFLLLLCIFFLVASLLYYSDANNNNNKKNNYGTFEEPLEGELRFISATKDRKLIEHDYRYGKQWQKKWNENPWTGNFLKEASHLRKCLGNFSLVWNEKFKFFTFFTYGKNLLTFNDGRLSLTENSSFGIKFAIVKNTITIEKNNLCGPKAEIYYYKKKNCVLIVQNNFSLASVIFNQVDESYQLKRIKSNIQAFYISHYFRAFSNKIQWFPGNLNDLSSFLALSFESQDEVLLGVPLCGSIIGVNQTCFLEFDSVFDMYLKMESLKTDKLNDDKSKTKSNENNLHTQNNFIPNDGSNKTVVMKIPPNPESDEKNESLKIVLIVIGSLLSVITMILFAVFIKMYYFPNLKVNVPVAENNNGLVFKKYSPLNL